MSGARGSKVQWRSEEVAPNACYEYIWLDADQVPRSKTKVAPAGEKPGMWNYDGSSTGQATTAHSEVLLEPVATYPDPFRGGDNTLVLCQTLARDGSPYIGPIATNTRHRCANVLTYHNDYQPMFGAEQEFFMIDHKTQKPLGFHSEVTPAQGQYYCGVGAGCARGRNFVEDVLAKGLAMGLPITGTNFEVAPAQAEFQVCEVGIDAADALVMLRYLLRRVGEDHGIAIDLSPKPLAGDWNGSGCHINFSTKFMRDTPTSTVGVPNAPIREAISRLSEKHAEHLEVYGTDNEQRLTGSHETSSYTDFSSGVANRSASVRIPSDVAAQGHGYIEDRRPASNVDPYLAYARIVETVCGPYHGEGTALETPAPASV